jgi:hypothetical protein
LGGYIFFNLPAIVSLFSGLQTNFKNNFQPGALAYFDSIENNIKYIGQLKYLLNMPKDLWTLSFELDVDYLTQNAGVYSFRC